MAIVSSPRHRAGCLRLCRCSYRVAGATGFFSATSGLSPAIGGRHTLIAVGQHRHTAAFTFIQVTPRILLTPAMGTAGAPTRALGYGFAAREPITL